MCQVRFVVYVIDVCPGATIPLPKGYYSRLLQSPAEPLTTSDEGKLIELGNAMRYNVEREGTLTPRVGYTYFGQFAGHDMTHDVTPLDGPYLDPELTSNYRTPYLDLEHVYEGGPHSSPHLYTGEAGAEIFKVGVTKPNSYLRDLPLENGDLLIQDRRNLDNIIVRQLHVLFLKFHNEAVKQLGARPPTITGIEGLASGTLFERAQCLVRWHYQWVVRHDFLPRILHPECWNCDRGTPRSGPQSDNGCSIPIEFSLAAYRFGHSMVRNAYGLNCRKRRVQLTELMRLGHDRSPLPDDYVIEWGRFLDGLPRSGPVASSSYIDTAIAAPLHELSASTIQLCSRTESGSEPLTLPVRTLLRGARAGLPSGQEVANALQGSGFIKSKHCLTKSQLTRDTCDSSGSTLGSTGLETNTPLFYYLLKDAEINGLGRTLGPIGSYIVKTVIQRSLESDPHGFISGLGRNWTLPSWRFPNGVNRPVNSLIGIIQLTGDSQLLPECEAKARALRPSPS
jgi:hypothetical protein